MNYVYEISPGDPPLHAFPGLRFQACNHHGQLSSQFWGPKSGPHAIETPAQACLLSSTQGHLYSNPGKLRE